MKPFSSAEIKQMELCHELNQLKSIFDVCEKTIHASGVCELRSVVDVLISTNEWLRRFVKVEHEYLSALEDQAEETVARNEWFKQFIKLEHGYLSASEDQTEETSVRSAEEVLERLTELQSIHSHYDVCATVVSDLKTDDLASLSEVFIGAAGRMWCLYDEQSKFGGAEV